MVTLSEVPGADFDDAMRQTEIGNRCNDAAAHFIEDVRGLLGCGDGENLHLVEFVAAQHSARVAAGRARFAPETG